MDLRPGYKQTEVGVIPEDWKVDILDRCVRSDAPICYGILMPGQFHDGGVPVVKVKDIMDGRICETDILLTHPLIDKAYRRSRLLSGDLVITIRGTTGRVAIVPEALNNANITQDTARVRVKSQSVEFLFFLFQSQMIQAQISLYTVGQAVKGINIRDVKVLVVPIPNICEQKAIAEVLGDADALIESLEQLIVKKRRLKQGAMQELLTGKKRLPGFEVKPGYKQTEVGVIPEDWDLENIENLACVTTGNKNTQDHIDDGQFPFFVRSKKVERINSFSFDGEAVLTAGDGVGTGKVFHYIQGKFDAHQRVYCISGFSENLNGYFFFHYFKNNFYTRIMKMTAKSSVDSVRREMITRMLIPIPRVRAEQDAIATVLSDMDAEIAALEAKLAKARQVKQGLMQVLLTGKVRLVGQEVAS